MTKIIDHQQTGKRKWIKGPGLKKDRDLKIYEDQSKLDLAEGIHTLFAVTSQQWYESLKRLISDKNLYKKISESGYKLVKQEFCVDQATVRLIEILKEVVNGSKA